MIEMSKRLLWHCLLVVSGSSLLGCAEVRIYGGQGVYVKNYFGIVKIDAQPKGTPVYLDSAGYGVILGSGSITFGLRKEQEAIFPNPNQCAILIIDQSPQDIKTVDNLLKQEGNSLANVCITGRSKSAQR